MEHIALWFWEETVQPWVEMWARPFDHPELL